jgi:SAM-dependent methyltransferase
MWTDVIDLRDFYDSPCGRTAARLIRRRIRGIWPDLKGLSLLGLGFPTPFLLAQEGDAARVLAIMPAAQGVLHWPDGKASQVMLADETALPLPDLSMDRILIVHALESTEHVRGLMREAWRVLSDSGRLLIVVPNRRGIWARLDRTPFGSGRPYTSGQLTRLLRDSLFTPTAQAGALYLPPVRTRMLLASALAVEEIGERWFPAFGGVLMCEAAKQVYAASLSRATAKSRITVALPQGLRREGSARSKLGD